MIHGGVAEVLKVRLDMKKRPEKFLLKGVGGGFHQDVANCTVQRDIGRDDS